MHHRRSLRVAVIANANLPIPPYYGYGGTQRGVYDFLVEFNKRGHRTTLYAPLTSRVSHLEHLTLRSNLPVGLWEPGNPYTPRERQTRNQAFTDFILSDVQRRNFDIVNIRSDDPELVRRLQGTRHARRLVYSLHNVRSMATLEPVIDGSIQCVAHCMNHRRQYGNLDNIRAITYGIDTLEYPFSPVTLSRYRHTPRLPLLRLLKERGQDYLITIGSIRPEKGQRTAIALARRVGLPLVIAGTPEQRSTDQFVRYFNEHVLPAVDGQHVHYFGNACEEDKKELLRFAKGFVFPSGFEDRRWEEPFGRAPVEATACGTPVVAFAHGSMREIIEPGVNGFLFETFEEAVTCLHRVEEIPRAGARRVAVQRFDRSRVAGDYEKLFYEMMNMESRWTAQPCRAEPVAASARPPTALMG